MKTENDIVDYRMRLSTGRGRIMEGFRLMTKLTLWKGVVLVSYGLKRIIDIAAASVALTLGSPLFALTASLIKFEDGGAVFFRQERVGYRGKCFGMYKFRSMRTQAESETKSLEAQNEMQGGVIFKMKNDPRVTRVGKFIRKYSIDELPQFWNVLVGDMSLVGPRPPLPKEVELYLPDERQRLLAKPGLTCTWQVSGRSEIDFRGQVRLDIEYIQSMSTITDIKLLIMTVPAVLLGKGAY